MFKYVLPPNIACSAVPTEMGLALQVKDKTCISQIILKVNKKFPLPSLKRVRTVDNQTLILLCSLKQLRDDCVKNNLQRSQFLQRILEEIPCYAETHQICEVTIPSIVPKTIIQNKNSPWPVSFHVNKILESKISGNIFKANSKSFIIYQMRKLISECENTTITAKKNTAIVSECENTSITAKKNTAIVSECENTTITAKKNAAIVCDIKNADVKVSVVAHEYDTMLHTCIRAIDEIAQRQVHHSKKRGGDETEAYLCTNLDIVIYREPCVMCAMALVHSRIRSVLFYRERDYFGGLLRARLHEISALNHSFDVYQIRLDD